MGLIYKGRHAGWYSVSDETFYPSTQVEQKEKDGEEYYVSTTSGSRVEWQEEENYMFRLSGFRTQLYDYYVTRPDAIYPPQHQVDIMKSLSDLEDLSVSRKRSRLTWGIPVPNDPEHTIYVWIDALTTYLSSVGYPFPPSTVEGVPRGAAQGWPPNVQVIGKDILRSVSCTPSASVLLISLRQISRSLPPSNVASTQPPPAAAPACALALDRRPRQDVQVRGERRGPHPSHRRVRHRPGAVLPRAGRRAV